MSARRVRTGRVLAWAALLLLLLLAAGGCQAPAARFRGATTTSCALELACQIAEDSAVELACHPVQSGQTLLAEPVKGLWTAGRGAVGKRLFMPCQPAPAELDPRRRPVDAARVEAELGQVVGTACKPAHLRLLTDGPAALSALERLIDAADQHIDVLMFQWENDALGRALAQRLADRASPQLRVRVLVDGGGNLIFGQPSHRSADDVNGAVAFLARQPHVEVIRTRIPFGRVDHRKLVLVDGRHAWTGGRNFTHKSFHQQHDLSLTLQGPLVADLQESFDAFWVEQGGKPGQATADFANREDASAPNAQARLVITGPMHHQIEQILYRMVDRAEHHVYLENYTFCDGLLVYKLAQARQRGVDVRVVLSFSDCTKALNRANRVIANRLRNAGVRVYVYPGMTHLKAASVDGCWAYLGTGNFDPLSLRRNRELGFVLGPCPLVEELEQNVFWTDFQAHWEVQETLPVEVKDYFYELLASLCL